MNVSRETLDRLRAYEALVLKWSPKINLVSKNTLQETWERHIVDSLQVVDLAPKAGKWHKEIQLKGCRGILNFCF